MATKELARILELEEGRVPHVYADHLGYQTIGVGRLVDRRKGGKLRDSEIDLMLSNDMKELEIEILQDYPWMQRISRVRLDGFILMRFQLGRDGMAGFKNTLARASIGDWIGVERGMLASLWARQTPDRVKRLAKQMRTNTYVFKGQE
jgi:lysozyme